MAAAAIIPYKMLQSPALLPGVYSRPSPALDVTSPYEAFDFSLTEALWPGIITKKVRPRSDVLFLQPMIRDVFQHRQGREVAYLG